MRAIVNIGLKVGDSSYTHSPEDAVEALDLNGLTVISTTLLESDSEPTLVAVVKPRIDTWLFANAINTVAIALEQDCIAVYKPSTGKGALIGPRSYKWGAFSPEYFFMPDGSRLDAAAKAA